MATKKTSPINPVYLDINTYRERLSDLEETVKRLRSDIHGSEKSQQFYGEAMAKQEDTETEWVEVERKQAAGLAKRVEAVEKLVGETEGLVERSLRAHRDEHRSVVSWSMLQGEAQTRREEIGSLKRRVESLDSFTFWATMVSAVTGITALVITLIRL